MALTPTLNSLEALYRKLERELYRAYHHRNSTHKADHFFNFCVTAHSMRDYFLERSGNLERAARQPFESQWADDPLLTAIAEIANSSKHFVLRNRRTLTPKASTTKKVGLGKGKFADIYMSPQGEIKAIPITLPDITITLSDGQKYELYNFMNEAIKYWKSFLNDQGIRIRRQPFSQLRGE
ncbi:hypothetical protein [Aquipseudomonas alcaligenes]|uniref:hypothetical protein n=1 Tax=Aquipseudomonas alcaligenes TaxID=43263 RepID=UPI001115579A|nr:hypothetical protein [Pseudomonas alcaligenes]